MLHSFHLPPAEGVSSSMVGIALLCLVCHAVSASTGHDWHLACPRTSFVITGVVET
ncbi:hypothetical protein [Arthrobacter methylotrophus]|uniref:hypothetical protein n=1 Tax=Arthrobacter methylotrophus TaxID=121291 RepID=UPI0031F0421C